MLYQLFYPNTPRDDISSAGTSVLQSYGIHVRDNDTVEQARNKIESEIRRLPTATWTWENQSEANELGDLRVWQRLPGMYMYMYNSGRYFLLAFCLTLYGITLSATRIHKQTGAVAFFNNVISRYLNAKDAGTLDAPHINKDGRYQPPAFVGIRLALRRSHFLAVLTICLRSMAINLRFHMNIWRRRSRLSSQ